MSSSLPFGKGNTSTHSQPPTHHKDNMSIGSAESLAPRWVSPGDTTTTSAAVPPGGTTTTPSSPSRTTTATNSNKPYSHIHWVGILRDDVMLCEYCNEPTNHKVLQMSRRFLKKNSAGAGNDASAPTPLPHKVDWEFKTYAIQSQRRMVHAIQFHLYELIPMIPGARAKLQHLQAQTFLNGETVRIIEYNATTQKYLIRPSIPLPDAQKLATTGMLVVHAKHLIPLNPPPHCITTYTIAALYDGKQLPQNLACQFVEKILILSENFRTPTPNVSSTNNNSSSGGGAEGGGTNGNNNATTAAATGEMSWQGSFGPILKSQMELFHLDIENAMQNNTMSIENSLEYSKQVIERNMDIVAQLSNLHAVWKWTCSILTNAMGWNEWKCDDVNSNRTNNTVRNSKDSTRGTSR